MKEVCTHRINVVIDTNVWISYLIGRKVGNLTPIMNDQRLDIIFTSRLIDEVLAVAHRPKFQPYFDEEDIARLEQWMSQMTLVELHDIPSRCRDPKDDYLLELAVQSQAIYLVSGDKDLLSLGQIEECKIMTIAQFIADIENILG